MFEFVHFFQLPIFILDFSKQVNDISEVEKALGLFRFRKIEYQKTDIVRVKKEPRFLNLLFFWKIMKILQPQLLACRITLHRTTQNTFNYEAGLFESPLFS